MDENKEWYNLKEINDEIWCISDKTGVNSYLVNGKKMLMIRYENCEFS